MNSSTPILVLLVLCGVFACGLPTKEKQTTTPADPPQEEPSQEFREAWMEQMHRTAPDVSWRQFEQQNQLLFSRSTAIQFRNNCGNQSFADGQLTGRWIERGSRNQAGSLLDITYLKSKDEIYAIAAGGSLWKSKLSDPQWEVVNQDLRLNRGILTFINYQNQQRLLAFINNWPHYSDDYGLTWIGAEESTYVSNYDGYFGHPVISQGPKQYLVFLSKPSYWSNLQLVYSNDGGQHLRHLKIFEDHDLNNFDLIVRPGTDQVWLLKRSDAGLLETYQIDFENNALKRMNSSSTQSAGQAALEAQFGIKSDSLALFTYTYNETTGKTTYYYSTTQGKSWKKRAELPVLPWTSTLHISSQNPNIQYIGEVDAYKSTDGGKNWKPINYWWEYYEDINHYLHADIMDIRDFISSEGEPFTLISNHGGLHISYDHFESMENLGLDGLNVSQYYSVRTHPEDPGLIYAGSQDQGLQATLDTEADSTLAFDQLIGGDYGHLAFTTDGESLWAVYPGGLIFFVANVKNGLITTSYELESADETVWLSPLHAGHSLSGKTAVLAGGNPEGGEGSYLVHLEYKDGAIKVSKGDFNFLAEAVDGTISAIEIAAADSNYQYVATTNGRFFYSKDNGQNWTQSLEFLPQGNYLYGQAVLASAKNPNWVYLAGSGYSNPAVLFSKDGGRTFVEKSNGLPPTLVYDLAMNSNESLLFAATEAGPFVYLIEKETWYYLGNPCTPNQTFWSVEYIPALERVRFGTYGRGIWDFQIKETPSTAVAVTQLPTPSITIFPNPSSEIIHIQTEWSGEYRIFNQNGQEMKNGHLQNFETSIEVDRWSPGVYYIQLGRSTPVLTQKIIVQ